MAGPDRSAESLGLPILLARVGAFIIGVEAYRVRAVDSRADTDLRRIDLRVNWGCPTEGPGKSIAVSALGDRLDLVVDEVLDVAVMPLGSLLPLPAPLDQAIREPAAVGLALVNGLVGKSNAPIALLLDVLRFPVPTEQEEVL